MTHIFISYAREDGLDFASTLIRKLEENGFDHWIDSDKIRIGDNFENKINAGIWQSFAVIVILTPGAAKSDYVCYEWIFALGADIRIIPLQFMEIEKSDLHKAFQNRSWEDFSNPKARPWDILFRQLKQTLDEYNPHNIASRRSSFTPPFVLNAVAQLESTVESDRLKAIDELAKSNHLSALEAIAKAVSHHMQDVRIYAAFTLAKKTQYIDKRAIPGLLEGLTSRQDSERRDTATELKRYGADAVPGIIEVLKDSFSEARYIAAVALGELKEKSAVPALVLLLDDDHSKVMSAAIDALAAIGDSQMIPALQNKLARCDQYTQLRIAKVLVKFGDYSIQDHLLKLLKATNSDDILGHIGETLLQIPNINIDELIVILKGARLRSARAVAAEILGIKGDRSAIAHLITALDDKEGWVRRHAAVALGRMSVVEAINKLVQQLDDADLNARIGAETALQHIGTQEALSALQSWYEKKQGDEM